MKRLLKRYTLAISLAAIPLSVAIACNFLTRSAGEIPVTGEPANSTVTEEAPIAGGTEEATLSGPGSGEVELSDTTLEFGPGAFDLDDPVIGLDGLSSYQATLALHFDGVRNGQPEEWSQTVQMRAVRGDSAFRQVIIENDGPVAGQSFMADANGMRYEQIDNGECRAESLADFEPLELDWEPAGLLFPLHGADGAQPEQVNGLDAKHYTFDARALGESKLNEAQGEVWLASDGGYVLRYVITKTGGENYFGEGMEGSMTWDYSLTDINQPLSLELPAGCPQGMVAAPLMPDAANVEQLPEVTHYTTSASVEQVLAFYAEELPALGWEVSGEPALAETTGLATYTLGDQQLTLFISSVETGRSVWLLQESKLEAPPEE